MGAPMSGSPGTPGAWEPREPREPREPQTMNWNFAAGTMATYSVYHKYQVLRSDFSAFTA